MENTLRVNLYELLYCFWMVNDSRKLPVSAIAMFFYLLNIANRCFWKMPFKCATSQISRELNMSEQTVLNSRKILERHGFIKCSKGRSRTGVPSYSLGDTLGVALGVKLGDKLGDDFNISKYNNTNKTNSISMGGEKRNPDLDELERSFLADSAWQEQVRGLLPEGAPLEELISQFFRYIRCSGNHVGSVDECRIYLVNWIIKQFKDRKNAVCKQSDRRRSAGVAPSSTCDYDGAF